MNFLGQGQGQGQGIGQAGQGIGQAGQAAQEIGDKVSSGLSSISSGLSSLSQEATSNVGFDSFYTMVVVIAVIILILVLAFLGWTMSKQRDTDNFPKLQTTCPDFWKVADGKCTQPKQGQVNSGDVNANKKAHGFSEADNIFDFTNSGWSAGGNAVCAKKKWANSHGINWDTVTNANYC